MHTKKRYSCRMVLTALFCVLTLVVSCLPAFAEEPAEEETATTAVVTEAEETTAPETDAKEPSESETTASTTVPQETSKTEPVEEETATEPVTVAENTKPDFASDYTGIAKTTYNGVSGWWRVENGAVKPNAIGVYQNEYGWWYVKNGKVDFGYTGIAKNNYGWWRIVKGKVDFKANGIYKNEYGWWKVEDGKVNFKYTGVAKNEYGWWRVVKGKVDFNATGAYSNEYGRWYCKNGKVDFSKTGTVTQGKVSFTVQKGKVTGVSLKVTLVNQLPNYPTGCEAASATMMLKYYGYDITLKKMIAAIPAENIRVVNGKRYGPKITEKFVGDPRATYTSKNPGYGAFAPVLTKSMNSVIQKQFGKQKADNVTGAYLGELLDDVAAGKPVMVWSTYNLQTPSTVNSWYIETPEGPKLFSYPRGTHVCLLVGFDDKNVYLADPYGAKTKTFSRSAFNDKYKLLGRQAVVIS